MLPLVLVFRDRKQINTYIRDLLKKNYSKAEIHEYRPDPNNITIDQIREITGIFKYASKIRKVIIIYDFETAKAEAQNAFLKTLEDSSEKAQFILVTGDINSLLPTVLSRCFVNKLTLESTIIGQYDFTLSVSKLMESVTLKKRDKGESLVECDRMIGLFRSRLIHQDLKDTTSFLKLPEIIKEVIRVRQYIEKNNINPQLGLDHLIIFIKTRLL